jgi:hypothetical protein
MDVSSAASNYDGQIEWVQRQMEDARLTHAIAVRNRDRVRSRIADLRSRLDQVEDSEESLATLGLQLALAEYLSEELALIMQIASAWVRHTSLKGVDLRDEVAKLLGR